MPVDVRRPISWCSKAKKSSYCSSWLSSHPTYSSVFSGAVRTIVSICPSVSSPTRFPWSSHTTCSALNVSFSRCSMSSFVIGWLRCGASRHCDVVNTVPFPSLSMAPPSRTKLLWLSSVPLSIPSWYRLWVMALSLSAANFSPHPLNLKSSSVFCILKPLLVLLPVSVMAAWSLAHVSLVSHW